MNNFKDFNIKPSAQVFTGDKIKMSKLLNRQIMVHHFKIVDSKYPDKGQKCLHMQISIGETKHVAFTGSKNLADMIQQVPPDKFPFTTTIVKEDERLEFT